MKNELLEQQITNGWKFKQADKTTWHHATVPGVVHTDLLENKLIEDPFYRTNEVDLQWIEDVDWEYQTNIFVNKDSLSKDVVEIQFMGLDTHADVFINEQLVLKANNQHRSWVVDVKELLQEGENSIRVYFHSCMKVTLPWKEEIDYKIQATFVDAIEPEKQVSMLNRKAGYHFGWDWGPRFVTSGIWRPVILRSYDIAQLNDVFIEQENITDDLATYNSQTTITTEKETECEITINVDGETFSNTASLSVGENIISTPISITKPKRWWPAGLGEAHLYTITTKIVCEDLLIGEDKTRIGVRTIELAQKTDSDGKGASFEFVVNGISVFMKGANYIPADSFTPRIPELRYRMLLDAMVDANMNMIRIWGGGIYEEQCFYDLCDEKGLIMWHDFMFACALFPNDKDFFENITLETEENIKRLRNHASLGLYCGNNEIEQFMAGPWIESKKDPIVMESYHKIFYDILPNAVKAYDKTKPYWPSSPMTTYDDFGEEGVDHHTGGDMHYWGVWHFEHEFSAYRKDEFTPRFMSEYGFQSYPDMKTINTFTLPEDHDVFSEVMLSHQKNPSGNGIIDTYMSRDYKRPKDFPSYIYMSQVLQAEAIKMATEHHRRSMPWCMGSLYWQLEDCWPVASWASIDYYGRWKALHYFAKKFNNQILVTPFEYPDKVEVKVVSDKLEDIAATLEMQSLDFNGKVLFKKEQNITIKANTSTLLCDIAMEDVLQGKDKSQVYFNARILINKVEISNNNCYLTTVKEMQLEQPEINIDMTEIDGSIEVTISTDKFAKNIYLQNLDYDGQFSDNYFDLNPGQSVSIIFNNDTPIKLDEFSKQFDCISMMDAFEEN